MVWTCVAKRRLWLGEEMYGIWGGGLQTLCVISYTLWFIKNVAVHSWSYLWKILMDFNNFYISRNGNECPLQVSYLLIYFTCDVNMTSLSRSWHWRAATVSAACVARLGAGLLIDDRPNTWSLSWFLSHWAHFTMLRFIFVYVYFVYVYFVLIMCCSIVTWWEGPDGLEAWSLGPLLPSVLWHYWLGYLTHKNSSPIWPVCVIVCLVGC